MTGKPVTEILDRLAARSWERASPGSAIGLQPSWRRDPFTMLIATVLSQRTRDESTWAAAEQLFSHFPDPSSLAAASEEDIDALITAANFHRGKARAVREIARIIHEEHGDVVPDDIEGLMALPMVGRKTANCVLAYAFHKDAICVDTHVHRISNRLGLVHTAHPDDTEEALRAVVPRDRWRSVNELMVRFGQEVCTPLRPRHELCPVREHCDLYLMEHGKVADRGMVGRRGP